LKHEELLQEVEGLLSPDSNAMKANSAKLLYVLLKEIPREEGFNCAQGCCPSSMPIDSTMGGDADPLSKEF
jgi:hypothetical protein